MKKILISTLIAGMAVSSVVVFAESERRSGDDDNDDVIRTTMTLGSVRSEEVRNNYFAPGYMTVRDDVKIPLAPEVGSVMASTEVPQSMWMTSLTRLKARALSLIRERINSLESNRVAINANKSLTTDQKTALTTILNTNITGLTALKATVASSTDATSTKSIINAIYTDFRIYGIVIPQVRLEKRIFDLQNHSTKLSDTFLKVQNKINEYKGKGKDVTVWQKSLDDAKLLVANDMNTLVVLLGKVGALKPSDYGTTSKMVIGDANTTIKKVAQDFNTVARTLNKSKILKNATSTPVVGTTTPPTTGTTTGTTSTTTSSTLPVYTLAQVATHSSASNCWLVISGKVYSVSSYISMHPGGSGAISSRCGQDATTAFETRGGSGTHSSSARSLLGGFLVGTL
jgi:cytochrome b involved in lipid metabolism